jgi:hypothetical protein
MPHDDPFDHKRRAMSRDRRAPAAVEAPMNNGAADPPPAPPIETLLPAVAVPTPAMTKGERDDLARLVRNRERVLKAAAQQRSAELLAEFEQQMASVYKFDQDEVWREAHAAAEAAVVAAQRQIAERCGELGIPADYAPGLNLYWHGRGENAWADRRAELRLVAKSRIAAIEKAARTKIELQCLDAQSQIVASGLTSAGAVAFLDRLPKIEALMPPLEIASIEEMLESRKRRDPFLTYRRDHQ